MKKLFCVLILLVSVITVFAQTDAVSHFNSGVEQFNRSEYSQAISSFTEAIRINPNYAEAYAWRARAYNSGNNPDHDRAINDANQAIQINPNLAMAYFARGRAYDGKNDINRAITDYTQSIRLDPNFVTSYNNRGIIYNDNNYFDLAIADFFQVIRLNPNSSSAYFYRGFAYANLNNYELAIADWETVLRLDPNEQAATNNLRIARERQPQRSRDEDFIVRQNTDNTITITGYRAGSASRIALVIPERLYGLPVTIIAEGAFSTVSSVDSSMSVRRTDQTGVIYSVVIPNTVTEIGRNAFRDNPNLLQVIIPDSVTTIGMEAFDGCGLISLTLGNGLRTIGGGAFRGNKLTRVTLPSGLRSIGGGAFENNRIHTVTVPASITEIPIQTANYGGMTISSNAVFYRNPITSATLGANITDNNMSLLGFAEGLRNYYVSQNRVAGNYVQNGPIWTTSDGSNIIIVPNTATATTSGSTATTQQSVTLTPNNPTATVNITSGRRVAITVSGGAATVRSNATSGDPVLFSAATGGSIVADDEVGDNWRYNFSANQTLYAGYYSNTASGSYTITATFR